MSPASDFLTLAEGDRFDLAHALDHAPTRPRRFAIALLCFLVLASDGYDLAIAGQMIPPIAESFGAPVSALMAAFAAQTFGQGVGAFVIAPFADQFGRRPLLLICLTLFGLATLASVMTTGVAAFTGLRLLTGMLGGALTPITISLLTDTAPLKWRSTFIGLAYAGLTIGALGAAATAGWLLEPYGWRIGFWIGGILPLVLVMVFFWLIPESPRHMARRNPADPAIGVALRRLGIDVPSTTTQFHVEPVSKGTRLPIVQLFRDGRAPLTLTLWTASILSLTGITLTHLLPTFYHDAGVSLAEFSRVQSLAMVGSLTAALTVGLAMDRVGRHRTLVILAVAGAMAFIALAFVPFGNVVFPLLLLLTGFTQNGAQMTLNILSPTLYPPQMRSTAVGWKGGVGKLSSSAAPIAASAVLASGAGVAGALYGIAGILTALVVCGLVLARVGRNLKPQ